MFCEKRVARNFTNFTGKHLCQRLFFNKVAGLRSKTCSFIKKESLAQVFYCEFVKFLRTPSFTAHLQWLLLILGLLNLHMYRLQQHLVLYQTLSNSFGHLRWLLLEIRSVFIICHFLK